MDCVLGEKEENWKEVEKWTEAAADEKVQLVLFPELFSTGYKVEEQDELLAEPIPGPTTEFCLHLARKYQLWLCGAIIEKAKAGLYDTAFLISPKKLVGIYRKTHFWKGEEKRFRRGRSFPVFRTKLGAIGLLICHDLRYPEAVRTLALNGAQILLVPSAFGKLRTYSWDVQTRARAMENGIFAFYANRVGQEPDFDFCGNSRIVNPWGKPIVSLSDSAEGMATADISLRDIPKAREEIPQLQQVRPKIYRYLTDITSSSSKSKRKR